MATRPAKLGRTRWPAYPICGAAGIPAGVSLALGLSAARGLSLTVMLAVSATAVATLPILVLARKLASGDEQLVQYHHQAAVLLAAAGTLWVLRRPLLPYLDPTLVGLALCLGFGRIGCLLAGCCYGRPCRVGVRYSEQHARIGFPRYLIGVRLFPVQAAEAAWLVVIAAVGSVLLLTGARPGEAAAWFVLAYSGGRFAFEFLRGDVERPVYAGFSEAQWTALLVSAALVMLELIEHASGAGRHAALPVLLVGAMTCTTLVRRLRAVPRDRLLSPAHVHDVARAVDSLTGRARGEQIEIRRTAMGVRISKGSCNGGSHYTLSSEDGTMSIGTARVLASLLLRLDDDAGPGTLLPAPGGVFHVVGGEAR
jgi:Prolipoprotein diacylglyceryl transferase